MNDSERLEALAHFGVKGMRWGQRKADTSGSSSKKSGSKSDAEKGVRRKSLGRAVVGAVLKTAAVSGMTILAMSAQPLIEEGGLRLMDVIDSDGYTTHFTQTDRYVEEDGSVSYIKNNYSMQRKYWEG